MEVEVQNSYQIVILCWVVLIDAQHDDNRPLESCAPHCNYPQPLLDPLHDRGGG